MKANSGPSAIATLYLVLLYDRIVTAVAAFPPGNYRAYFAVLVGSARSAQQRGVVSAAAELLRRNKAVLPDLPMGCKLRSGRLPRLGFAVHDGIVTSTPACQIGGSNPAQDCSKPAHVQTNSDRQSRRDRL